MTSESKQETSDNPRSSNLNVLRSILGRLENNRGARVPRNNLSGKLIGFYFAAVWSPQCQFFSSKLTDFLNLYSEDFIVAFVSMDHTKQEMKSLSEGTGWYNVPFDNQVNREFLCRYFHVTDIPTLIIYNPRSDQIITDKGKHLIEKVPEKCIEKWKAGESGYKWYHSIPFI